MQYCIAFQRITGSAGRPADPEGPG